MILRKLKLQNIRSYISQEIDFPESSIMLSGDIGSGKSSILLAIEFAFFGIVRGDLSGDSLLRKGCTEGSVELSFSIQGKECVVKRVLKKSPRGIQQSSGYTIIDGVEKEGTAVEIKARILELLGYPENLVTKSLIYRYTVYTPQEEMKRIIQEQEDVRLDILRKVFNIDKYRQIKENTAVYLSSLRDEIVYYEAKLENESERKKEAYRLKEEVDELFSQLEKLIPEDESLKEKKKRYLQELNQLEEKLRKKQELKQQLHGDAVKEIELEKSLRSNKEKKEFLLKKIAELEESVPDESTESSEIKSNVEVVKNDLGLLERKQEELDKKKKEQTVELANLRAEHQSLKERFEKNSLLLQEISKKRVSLESEQLEVDETTLQQLIEEKELQTELLEKQEQDKKAREVYLQTRIEDSQKLLSQIRSMETCPTCMQHVNEGHRQYVEDVEKGKIHNCENELSQLPVVELRNAKEELEKLKERASHYEVVKMKKKTLNDLVAEIEKIHEENAQFTQLIGKKKELIDQLEHEMESEESYEGAIKEKKSHFEQLQEKLRKVEIIDMKRNDLLDKKEQIKKLDDEVSNVTEVMLEIAEKKKKYEQQMSEFDGIEDMHGRLKEEYDVLIEQEKEMQSKVVELKTRHETSQISLRKVEEELKFLGELTEKLEKVKSLRGWFRDHFMHLIDLIERHVMMKIHKEFNLLFQEWFNYILEDQDISARLDDKFNPIIEQQGHEISFSDLSGGEKTSVSLAYRLALNKVINEVIDTIQTKDFIILDEPTDGFSSEQLDRLKDVLDKVQSQQLIIVSHESKIENIVNHVVRVEKRHGESIIH